LPILPGDQVLRVSHQATGNLNGQAIISLDSAGSSRPETGELDMSPSIVRLTGEGFEIGLDRLTKVSSEYKMKGIFAYPGRIDWVKIEPGPQADDSFINLAEEVVQKDW